MKQDFKMIALVRVISSLFILGVAQTVLANEPTETHIDHHRHMGGHMHMHMSDDHAMDPNSPRFANAKKLADKACADCHGKAGISKTDDNPNLAGQDALYFCKTMYDYRSRARNLPPIKTNDGLYVPNMNEVTDKLSDQDIVDLSEYYAHLRAQ